MEQPVGKFPHHQMYNFYSSGEEVLREDPNGAPPTTLLASIPQQVISYLQGAAGLYAWAWQEKDKGRCLGNGFVGSNHGGWGFNPGYDTTFWYQDGLRDKPHGLGPGRSGLPDAQLRTNAFFNTNAPDGALLARTAVGTLKPTATVSSPMPSRPSRCRSAQTSWGD